jgi:exo-1,4-beta-D-glucosaminidase
MTPLLTLPKATVISHIKFAESPEGRRIEVQLRNTSKVLAFQVSAAARTSSGDLIAPVFWSDNYIELMPGESRTLTALLPKDAPANPEVLLSGWNISPETLHGATEPNVASR